MEKEGLSSFEKGKHVAGYRAPGLGGFTCPTLGSFSLGTYGDDSCFRNVQTKASAALMEHDWIKPMSRFPRDSRERGVGSGDQPDKVLKPHQPMPGLPCEAFQALPKNYLPLSTWYTSSKKTSPKPPR
jgi:hypothetical protein